MEESKVNKGHTLFAKGENYEDSEKWKKAFEAFKQASVLFEKAAIEAENEDVKITLKALSSESLKRMKLIEPRVSKIMVGESFIRTTGSKITAGNLGMSGAIPPRKQLIPAQRGFNFKKSSTILSPDAKGIPSLSTGTMTGQSRRDTGRTWSFEESSSSKSVVNEPDTVMVQSATVFFANSPSKLNPSLETETTSFDRFWTGLEQLAEYISNPVAFASAPLLFPDSNGGKLILSPATTSTTTTPTTTNNSNNTSANNTYSTWLNDKNDIDFSKPMGQSYYFIPKELTNLLPQEKLPLNPNPKANPLLKPEANENKKELPKSSDYFEENKLLRLKLEEQVKLYEKVMQENQALKTTILQIREEFRGIMNERNCQEKLYNSSTTSTSLTDFFDIPTIKDTKEAMINEEGPIVEELMMAISTPMCEIDKDQQTLQRRNNHLEQELAIMRQQLQKANGQSKK